MIASRPVLVWQSEGPYVQLIYGAVLPQSLAIQWSYGEEHGGYTDHELALYRWICVGFVDSCVIDHRLPIRNSIWPAKRYRVASETGPIPLHNAVALVTHPDSLARPMDRLDLA